MNGNLIRKYLVESSNLNSIVFYHITNFNNAMNILKHNYFRTSINSETDKRGLSTTTDKKYFWGSKDVRFLLDSKKVKKSFKVIPIESIVSVDESEILILHDGAITNANKYIREIQYNNNAPKFFIDELNDYTTKFNIKTLNRFK